MRIKSDIKGFTWMVLGAMMLLIVLLLVWHYQTDQSPTEQLAIKANRVNLVDKMRLSLVSASEAEKSSVMAITDQESQTFADQSRTSTTEVEQDINALDELLKIGGTNEEKNLLVQFAQTFIEFQSIDKDLLAMAVRNTNIKATNLTYGAAADALTEMDLALSHLIKKAGATPEAKNVILFAYGAQNSSLRIQVLLPQHIAEGSDKKMDEFEVLMNKEDHKVHLYLDSLAILRNFREDPYLKKAVSDYTHYNEIRSQILILSHENSNVLSLSLSLGKKRQVFLKCLDILSTLQQTIMKEPIPGVNYGNMSNPRSLQIEK
jgi:hypothetical protein